MNLKEINLHDSLILKVIEDCQNDTLDFVLYYPIDYENNFFEIRTLRFYDFLNYKTSEIPFGQLPTILDFEDLGIINTQLEKGKVKLK